MPQASNGFSGRMCGLAGRQASQRCVCASCDPDFLVVWVVSCLLGGTALGHSSLWRQEPFYPWFSGMMAGQTDGQEIKNICADRDLFVSPLGAENPVCVSLESGPSPGFLV